MSKPCFCVNIANKCDNPLHVNLLVVEHRQVAAVRTEEVSPLPGLVRPHLQILRIHRSLTRSDHQSRHGDLRQIGCAIPMQDLASGAEFARPLHN